MNNSHVQWCAMKMSKPQGTQQHLAIRMHLEKHTGALLSAPKYIKHTGVVFTGTNDDQSKIIMTTLDG